eukprot:SAG31_NODE_5216_length_2670_cov_1.605212_4_plen_222_part_00
MISTRHGAKLGGRGCLQPGQSGTVADVDVAMKAGGRIQVQNDEGKKYWYDYEALVGVYDGPPQRVDEPSKSAVLTVHAPTPEPDTTQMPAFDPCEPEAERPDKQSSNTCDPELMRLRRERLAEQAAIRAAGIRQALADAEETAAKDRVEAAALQVEEGHVRRELAAERQRVALVDDGGVELNADWDDSDDGSDGDSSYAETEDDEDVIDDILAGIASDLGN